MRISPPRSRRVWMVCLGVASLALATSFSFAQDVKSERVTATASAEGSPVPPKKRSLQSISKPYFVEFRARSAATYGHMYVLYGKVNAQNEIVMSDIAGLHPAGDANDCENCSVVSWALGHLVFVPSETGASDGDLEEKYVSARYRVMVDAATFKKVSGYISKLKADTPMWNALWRNCVSFGNEIAQNLGMKTPGFPWMEPKDYVESLRNLNGGSPQGALKFAARTSMKSSPSGAVAATNTNTAAPITRKPKNQPVANLPQSRD